MRILVVEDESELGILMIEHLRRQGFAADLVGCLDEAEAAVRTTAFDAIVLDLNLPDGDGQDFIRHLRASDNWAPVLAATARETVDQRIRSLDLGADDYLVKPFDLRELTARLRALLRRPALSRGTSVRAGNVVMHTASHAVEIAGTAVTIHRRQFALLESLILAQGRVVSRAALEDSMYDFDDQIESNALESQVSRLRKALADSGASVGIVTVRGVGYMLVEVQP